MIADTASAGQRDVVVLGTATPGGGFPLYGAALAATINEIDSSLAVTPRNTKGSTENVPLLEAGQIDIALVQGEVAYEALSGIGRPPAALMIVAAMYSTPGMFVVRADSPYRTINDLRGNAVAFGARGSGLVILARYVLDGIGLDQEKDFTAVYLDRAGDGPAMVMDGRVAALWGGGTGWPGLHRRRRGAGRCPLHRTQRRAGRPHPRQARLPQDADDPCRQLSRPGRCHYLGRIVELHPRPSDACRRRRVSSVARAPSR